MTDEVAGRAIDILLVEDSPGDAELTMEALEHGRISNHVHVALDGEDAIEHMRRSLTGSVPRPDLILLDLNLPRMDGREVLQELKRHDQWRRIPVIVLSSSRAPTDILQAYDLHANAYITKPVTAEQFISTVRLIGDYWLSIVQLPPR